MNVTKKIVCGIALAGVVALPAMAGGRGDHHRHHGGNDGVRLAAEIIGLVRTALTPVPAVTFRPEPPPPPRHEVRHPAPHHGPHAPAPHHGRR